MGNSFIIKEPPEEVVLPDSYGYHSPFYNLHLSYGIEETQWIIGAVSPNNRAQSGQTAMKAYKLF